MLVRVGNEGRGMHCLENILPRHRQCSSLNPLNSVSGLISPLYRKFSIAVFTKWELSMKLSYGRSLGNMSRQNYLKEKEKLGKVYNH